MSPKHILGLRDIADQYALFVVDQWGVLHDGHTPLPGAIEALRGLKETGAAVTLLSNSGKRVSESYKRLTALGFDRSLYDLAITSGEQVHHGLSTRDTPFYAALGPRYLMFAWDEDRGIVEDTGFEEVDDIDQADFILCAGTDRRSLEDYQPILARALERDLPLTCANPDRVSVQPDGSLKVCPGAIAEMYERMGGRVQWHGKPGLDAYHSIRDITGVSGSGLGIGDSLAHDIAGANAAGLDGLFITGGIHRGDLPTPPTSDAVTDLGSQFNAVPAYFSEAFRW
ncbi:MAG: TIGR01459 family HAD-type hydrolase [Rhodospirillaceae bacterium]|nr:TIGR01459 family HAD-type hydrolase [Rhodospirillaceae bacterium]MBB56449.1 TIGR01459 family HAD-type hydrolase [Rhodospirillaceae bacterium]|tara:strand:- start:28885 stop:29736 length:852 start_codon:yes stop_codon:yes gene_type:complete